MGKPHARCSDTTGQENQGNGLCQRSTGTKEPGGVYLQLYNHEHYKNYDEIKLKKTHLSAVRQVVTWRVVYNTVGHLP